MEAVQVDVTDAADLERLFATMRERAGRIDILVASSGMSKHATQDAIAEEHFERTFDLHVCAMVFKYKRRCR